MNPIGLPRVTPDLRGWATELTRYLSQAASKLRYKPDSAAAPNDGSILWDATGGYPVVSKGGVWRQVVLADGFAILGQDTNVTAAAADTAYEIALDEVVASGITLTGSPATDITFMEAGLYSLAFAAQISSTSGSQVDFRFWPRINDVDVEGSTIVASLHNNGATTVVSRTAIFSVAAGDVLNVMWATSSTNGFLDAKVATAYAPSAPAVTLAINRVQA